MSDTVVQVGWLDARPRYHYPEIVFRSLLVNAAGGGPVPKWFEDDYPSDLKIAQSEAEEIHRLWPDNPPVETLLEFIEQAAVAEDWEKRIGDYAHDLFGKHPDPAMQRREPRVWSALKELIRIGRIIRKGPEEASKQLAGEATKMYHRTQETRERVSAKGNAAKNKPKIDRNKRICETWASIQESDSTLKPWAIAKIMSERMKNSDDALSPKQILRIVAK